MKSFITIFPKGTNIHLIKDVGMIPFYLKQEGYYDTYISFYEHRDNLAYLDSEVKGLKYIQLKKRFDSENLNILLFLLLNMYRFDVVMFFHQDFIKTLIALFIKIITFNRIKFYFKLDANDSIKESKLAKSSGSIKKVKIFLYNCIDLISVETKHIHHFLTSQLLMNVAYIPNGFNFTKKDINKYEESIIRERIISTVGRIGAPEKDTLTLLKALSNLDFKDWKVEIIGPIENEFNKVISDFLLLYPHLQEKLIFRGPIYDREELFGILKKSSVFVQTSRFESFGLALLEAMSCGCFIVSTDLTPSMEIAGDYGVFFKVGDTNRLTAILQSIILEELSLPSDSQIIKYAEKEYSWAAIAGDINFYLNK